MTLVEIRFNVELLKKLMEQGNMRQAELARRLKVDRSCVNKILNENRIPEIRVLIGLVRVFPNYSVEDFLFLEDRPTQARAEM